MEDIPEIRLHIENQVFTVRKDLLCEHSDYFRAMFSGNYVEKEQHDISIDIDAVDANSMNIVLRYMEMGLIDLSEYELPEIGSLAVAANFLQIAELIKQIEYCLDIQLSITNWIETMTIAENAAYTKLEQTSAAFGLLSFKTMLVSTIPSIEKLFWYLSHPYLDASSELDVFKFGLQWVFCKETGADALLILLGCLSMKRLTFKDLEEIKKDLNTRGFANSLAEKVVECLLKVCTDAQISGTVVRSMKEILCQMFTERVYVEVLNLVTESPERKLAYTPVVPVWMLKDAKLDFAPHFMYKFSEERGFEQWLEVADKNLWGWTVVSWGAHKLVIVGGEHGRGTSVFMRDVKVYDTLRQEWISHGVQLPPRRHGGVTMILDTMFLIGGVGGFRVTLDTAITYDMTQRSFRKIAKLPDAIQSPAICTHKGEVYAAGHKNIYKYDEEIENIDKWVTAISTEMRSNRITSFKEYIYCAQNYFSPMFRFKPGVDKRLELITCYSHPPAAICNFIATCDSLERTKKYKNIDVTAQLNRDWTISESWFRGPRPHDKYCHDRLIVFTRPTCGQPEFISVEEYKGEPDEMPKIIFTTSSKSFTVNDVAGCCTLIINIPPLYKSVSQYHKKYLSRYSL